MPPPLGIEPSTGVVSAVFSQGKLSTVADETRVLFDGEAAPIIYAAKDQVSCFAPLSVAGKVVAMAGLMRIAIVGFERHCLAPRET